MTIEEVKVLFGRRVRQLRMATGVSQEAFAHMIKIDRSYFGSIERGERNVSLENIFLIANGLGVHIAELMIYSTHYPSRKGRTTRRLKSDPPTTILSPSLVGSTQNNSLSETKDQGKGGLL